MNCFFKDDLLRLTLRSHYIYGTVKGNFRKRHTNRWNSKLQEEEAWIIKEEESEFHI